MRESNPALRLCGPPHALWLRGLHVRQSSGARRLVLPMPQQLLEPVRALCERSTLAEVASVLGWLERDLRADLERLQALRERASTSGVASCC